jgi:hypothetical protein
MKQKDWVWMPHPAHYCLGDKCRFVLSTYVGEYIVSTVGELWNDQDIRRIHASIFDPEWFEENKGAIGDNYDYLHYHKFGYGEIGFDRKYETMVFRAKRSKEDCCQYEIVVEDEMDMRGYNDAKSAREGHMELCVKWAGAATL